MRVPRRSFLSELQSSVIAQRFPRKPRSIFTACISIHNTALRTQRVMPIEKQSFPQQSTAVSTLIECVTAYMCMFMALYHKAGDNCLCNTTQQFVVNSVIGLDCFCLVVSHGLAYVFVLFVRKQKVPTINAGHVPSDCLCWISSNTHTVQRQTHNNDHLSCMLKTEASGVYKHKQ